MRRGFWLIALFLLGFAGRVLIIAIRPGAIEAWEYESLATSIAAGQGYVIARFGHVAYAFGDGNLYSFLAATTYVLIGHQPLVLALLQAALASLAAPVIFLIGERAFGPRVAGLGACLAALHPGLLAYTLKLHPLGLDVLLLALSVAWVARRNNAMSGFGLGVALMSRPTFFVAGVVGLLVSRLSLTSFWRRFVSGICVPVVIALAIAAPWVARNWAVLGRPVLISTSLEDVWKGNNPAASGSSYVASGVDVFSVAPDELRVRMLSASELQLNDIFADEIVSFITQHPGDFASLTARKFFYFWWFSPEAGMLYPSGWLLPYATYFAVVMGFAAIGAVTILRHGSPWERSLLAVLLTLSLTVALIHALSYVEGRHRWGIEPLLLLLTARGMFAVAGAVHVESWTVLARRRAPLK